MEVNRRYFFINAFRTAAGLYVASCVPKILFPKIRSNFIASNRPLDMKLLEDTLKRYYLPIVQRQFDDQSKILYKHLYRSQEVGLGLSDSEYSGIAPSNNSYQG